MSNPSLLCVPYRFKTSKLYSQIPDSGLGDFTVTRSASNAATRVNAAGFIETVADNVPRLDYPLGGITAGCPALLVEPAATNLVPNGVGFNAATGVQTSGVTDSPAVAISGTLVTKNEASGTIRYGSQTFSASALSSATTYSVSRFFKYNGVAFSTTLEANSATQWGNVPWKQVVVLSAASGVTLGASTSCTGSIENFGNGWYRVSVRVTTGATIGGAATVDILSELPAALSTGQGFLTACPQLETGSVATSYIPTTTAAITRGAETVSKTGVSSLIGQTQGTIYAEVDVRFLNSTNRRILYISDGTTTNSCDIRIDTTNVIRCVLGASTTSGTVGINSSAITTGIIKIAFAYKSGDFALSVNGATALTASGTFTFGTALSNIVLGNQVGGTTFLNDRIRAHALYPTRLTNAQLQSLTQ